MINEHGQKNKITNVFNLSTKMKMKSDLKGVICMCLRIYVIYVEGRGYFNRIYINIAD